MKILTPDLYRKRSHLDNKKRDAYLREQAGIDPALLAHELGVSERFIIQRQRRLGVRKCTHSPRKADRDALYGR